MFDGTRRASSPPEDLKGSFAQKSHMKPTISADNTTSMVLADVETPLRDNPPFADGLTSQDDGDPNIKAADEKAQAET